MNVSQRLSAILLGGLAASCVVGLPSARAQSQPENPLRQAIKPAPVAERTAPEPVPDRVVTQRAEAVPTTAKQVQASAASAEPVQARKAAANPATDSPSGARVIVDPAVQQAAHVASTGAASASPRVAPRGRAVPARQTAYGLFGRTHIRRGYTPTQMHGPNDGSVVVGESHVIEGPNGGVVEGEIIYDGSKHMPGEFYPTPGDCHECGGGGCGQCCLIPCPVLSLDNVELFAGVQGFTGPKNLIGTGSFGFHEGFNWGAPVPCTTGALGMQVGLNAVHSNFSGAAFTDDSRNQLFLTGGLFRRVDWGLQGGLVVDYLSDDWYTDTDLMQLRGELSWMFPCTQELGFWFTAGTQDDEQTAVFTGTTPPQDLTWQATDLYAFFYRHHFGGGATARLFAGFSADSDGLVGGELRLPLGCDWALQTGFSYLVPEQATTGLNGGGHEEESWNVGITFVWYPGCRKSSGVDYYRPLFNVADNGSFMVDQL